MAIRSPSFSSPVWSSRDLGGYLARRAISPPDQEKYSVKPRGVAHIPTDLVARPRVVTDRPCEVSRTPERIPGGDARCLWTASGISVSADCFPATTLLCLQNGATFAWLSVSDRLSRNLVDIAALVRSTTAGVFAALSNPTVFQQVSVEHGAVTWPGDVDLAPDAMYDAIQASGEWRLM